MSHLTPCGTTLAMARLISSTRGPKPVSMTAPLCDVDTAVTVPPAPRNTKAPKAYLLNCQRSCLVRKPRTHAYRRASEAPVSARAVAVIRPAPNIIALTAFHCILSGKRQRMLINTYPAGDPAFLAEGSPSTLPHVVQSTSGIGKLPPVQYCTALTRQEADSCCEGASR
jgi:hypothetical protein